MRKWEAKWNSPLLSTNRKYRSIRNSVAPWLSSYHPCRRYERIISRLRIGHSRLTHSFLLDRDGTPPVCDHCQQMLTIEHILVECRKFSRARMKYHLCGKDLASLIGEDIDVDNLMMFLKDIDLFYEF